jgi:hypothetical protein
LYSFQLKQQMHIKVLCYSGQKNHVFRGFLYFKNHIPSVIITKVNLTMFDFLRKFRQKRGS